jgi:phenylpropionate dioxygenase-like ring-hydroxylating dioxygenase large terminal subunit
MGGDTYIRNSWYMAGWSDELTDKVISRRVFDRQIAFFRDSKGDVQAIADRCPHRFAPLSLGDKQGDTLVCPYHGLTFDGTGNCVRNPFAEKIPSGARVDSWTCIERYGMIWLWGGEAATSDPAAIPNFSLVEDNANTRVVRGYTLLDAPYQFGTDNLMDLSHIEFVHKGSFAGNGVIFGGEYQVVDDGHTLRSNWWMPGVKAPPHTIGVYDADMVTDHWLDMRWNAPASMQLEIGACPQGGKRTDGVTAQQCHILTPASATTAHYFWATTRYHAQAFDEEDKPIIKAAYENLEGQDFWEAKPLSLGIDQGGTRARRKIEAMLKAEKAKLG